MMHSEEMARLPVGNWILHFQSSAPRKIHGGSVAICLRRSALRVITLRTNMSWGTEAFFEEQLVFLFRKYFKSYQLVFIENRNYKFAWRDLMIQLQRALIYSLSSCFIMQIGMKIPPPVQRSDVNRNLHKRIKTGTMQPFPLSQWSSISLTSILEKLIFVQQIARVPCLIISKAANLPRYTLLQLRLQVSWALLCVEGDF